MKAKIRPKFPEIGKKEIRKQIIEQESRYLQGIDAVFLWSTHVCLGLGAKRLKRLYKDVIRIYKEMSAYYEMEGSFPAECKLKEIGLDMDELRKETFDK